MNGSHNDVADLLDGQSKQEFLNQLLAESLERRKKQSLAFQAANLPFQKPQQAALLGPKPI